MEEVWKNSKTLVNGTIGMLNREVESGNLYVSKMKKSNKTLKLSSRLELLNKIKQNHQECKACLVFEILSERR